MTLVRSLGFVVLALAACTKDPAPTAPPSAPGRGPLDTETYAVSITADGAWKANAEGAAKINVTAKAPLHVNPEYPVSFKPDESETVKFAEERIRLRPTGKKPCEAKAEDTCSADFKLDAVPGPAGQTKVSGLLAFSVCSAEKCLIEKVPLELAVNVEP